MYSKHKIEAIIALFITCMVHFIDIMIMVDRSIDRIDYDLALKHVTQDPSKIQRCVLAVKPVNCFSVENCVFGHLRSRISHAYPMHMRDVRTQMR